MSDAGRRRGSEADCSGGETQTVSPQSSTLSEQKLKPAFDGKEIDGKRSWRADANMTVFVNRDFFSHSRLFCHIIYYHQLFYPQSCTKKKL